MNGEPLERLDGNEVAVLLHVSSISIPLAAGELQVSPRPMSKITIYGHVSISMSVSFLLEEMHKEMNREPCK